MCSIPRARLCRFRSRISAWRYRLEAVFQRSRRAWHYACGSLLADNAQSIFLDCRHPAGWYPLLVLTVEDTLDQAREMFADHPDLPRLVACGCARVDAKWAGGGDELYEARRWAIHVAAEYAAEEGVAFVPIEEETSAQKTENEP